jgi:hypothetical protein
MFEDGFGSDYMLEDDSGSINLKEFAEGHKLRMPSEEEKESLLGYDITGKVGLRV